VTTAKRSKVLPGLPTLAEAGVRGYENSTWFGVIAPAGTPPAVIGRLNAELVKASQAPEIVERIAPDGGEPVGTTPEQFGKHIATEIARWRKVVKDAGIRIE
jgi:tripartite-type tricarboxylate transporter receptor subunit TctC